MNKETVLNYLLSILEGAVEYLPIMLTELKDILSRSGYEQKFGAQLFARLNMLRALGADVIKAKEFERIDDTIYSMHCTGTEYNIRILFAFTENGLPLLLLAFFERGGKRKTDYAQYIPAAYTRLEEYNETHRQ